VEEIDMNYQHVYCMHCGHDHGFRVCPHVKAIDYYENGSIKRVEYKETMLSCGQREIVNPMDADRDRSNRKQPPEYHGSVASGYWQYPPEWTTEEAMDDVERTGKIPSDYAYSTAHASDGFRLYVHKRPFA
jgi:hypothetical protein